jgi:hypothetical protein
VKREDRPAVSRRRLLGLALLLGATTPLLWPRRARAQKTSKEHALYQDSPNAGFQCSGCKFFIAPQSGAKVGACRFVEGDISPKGWCMFYNPKA